LSKFKLRCVLSACNDTFRPPWWVNQHLDMTYLLSLRGINSVSMGICSILETSVDVIIDDFTIYVTRWRLDTTTEVKVKWSTMTEKDEVHTTSNIVAIKIGVTQSNLVSMSVQPIFQTHSG